ncbi:isopentenyl transferase [Dorcoceras hygrometricum]|uniref:Isopentenyl transferase n=1 Tax=Dorcoceras hygrometricum TaxID=472368 RepID=A0A2Z7BJN0_9LAMI|nr:isopentenyl transferase [Dorcoceras hygrometricum]
MMNSRRICPADGSQYKDSAVVLVFMESAAGLAMETSKVESAVRNQTEAKLNQLEHIARSSRELQWIQSQASLLLYIQSTWYPDARKAKVAKLDNQTQATALSVESFYEPAVALYIQSQRSRRKIPVAVFEDSAEAQSSSRLEPAAKQLTIYEESSKLDVNC